jgi:hypothetical protein
MSVVSASSLLTEEASVQYKPSTVDKEDNLEYDLGNLMAFDPNPLNESFLHTKSQDKLNDYLMQLGRDNSQLLFNHIFQLPSRALQAESGRLADLPTPSSALPRAKPIPKAKEPTKWYKYTIIFIHSSARIHPLTAAYFSNCHYFQGTICEIERN